MIRSTSTYLLLLLLGCAQPDGGSQLLIMGTPIPNDNCELSTTAALFRDIGAYDPTLGYDFTLHTIIQNNLESREEDPTLGVSGQNVRPEMNNAMLRGFEACWYRVDTSDTSAPNSHDDGRPIECSKLPADQRRFALSSGVITPAGGLSVTVADLLTKEDLQAAGMFGANWDPMEIPPLNAYTYWSEDPAAGGRDPGWGTYPVDTERRLQVLLQVQAVAQLESGEMINSNWYAYPIDMCVGCFAAAACGGIVPVVCEEAGVCSQITCPASAICPYIGGACTVGDTCVPEEPCPSTGICTDDTLCQPEVLGYAGLEYLGGCMPAEGFGIACGEYSTCP